VPDGAAALARVAARTLDAPAVLLAARRGRHWVVRAVQGLPAAWADGVPEAWLSPGYAAALREPLAIEDTVAAPLAGQPMLAEAGARAALVATAGDRNEGVLLVAMAPEPRAWTADDREAARDLADMAFAGLAEESERRRLRDSLRTLHTALETMQLGVTVTDQDGRIVYTNPAEAAMHGWAVEELLGEHARVLAPRALWSAGERPPAVLGSWTRESVNARRDGSEFPVMLWSDAVADDEGRVLGLVTCCQDVTAARAAEEALRTSEERFRQLAEHIDAVFYVNDGADLARTTYVSPAYERLWGRSRESLFAQPRSWTDAVHPDDRARVHAALSMQVEAGYDVEYRIVRPDGGVRWIHDRSFAIRDAHGRVYRYAGIAEDVTARRTAEEALRASEQRYRELFEEMPVGLYRTAPDGRLLDVNSALASSLGFADRAGLLAADVNDLVADPADRAEWRRRIDADGVVRDFETLNRRRDGTLIWLRDSARAVRGPDGEVRHYDGVLEDVTERRHAQEALRRAHDELETRVRERTAELDAANRRLRAEVEERSRSQAALRDSEERYRLVAETASDAIVTIDEGGTIVYANPAAARIFGIPAGHMVGSPLVRLMPERVRARHRAGLNRYLETGERRLAWSSVEVPGMHANGTEIPLELSFGELQDGPMRLLTAVIRDVSERRRAADALRVSEERFRTVVENLGEAILLTDLDDRVLYASPLVHQVTGYAPAEMEGAVAHELLLPGPEKQTLLDTMKRRAEGASERYQVPITRKDGTRAWIEVIGTPLRDAGGEVVGTLGAITDITERLRSEQELRAVQERFRLVVETVRDFSIVTLDTGGFVLSWNAGGERITGYAVEEILGRHLSVFYTPDEQAAGLPAAVLDRAAAEGRAEQEGWRVRKDGTAFWAHTVLNALHDDAGGRIGFAAITRDLTAAREAEEALRRSEEQLRHSQKMEAVGRLAGGIAHDFNNILMAMGGNVQLLLRQTPPHDPRREELDEVKKGADRAAALTQQLLAFSRRQVLQPRVVNLSEVMDGMVGMLERVVNEDVEILTRFVASPAHVKADPGQLEQVVMNLVVNSRDAMPDGGVIVLETRTIDVGEGGVDGNPGAAPGTYVGLSVTDTGMGMDAAVRERVFEPFFTTKEEGKGTGLGLSTVYGIVQQSEGFLTLESRPGVATTVAAWFPLAREAAAEAASAQAAPLVGGDETVLLVEDEEAVRRVVRKTLAGAGYHVLEARRASEALEHLAGHPGPVHLLLTDVVMPGMSGVELARRVGTLRSGVRVLFFSGYAPDRAVQHAVAAGRAGFLQKPAQPDDLVRRVRETLDAGREP
jgi:PAS domain S-box-containing protein